MSATVAELSRRIVEEAKKTTASREADVLSHESLAKLYSCAAQLIGPHAEDVLWDWTLSGTSFETDGYGSSPEGVLLRPVGDSSTPGALTVPAERFVGAYILCLSRLVGPRLTMHHLEYCFPRAN